jgi:hypothetical protein
VPPDRLGARDSRVSRADDGAQITQFGEVSEPIDLDEAR